MKRSIALYLIFIFVLAQTGWAQSKSPLGKSDPKAKAILDKASKQFSTYQSLKVNFTLKVTSTDHKTLVNQKGVLWLKGKAYKFEMGAQTVYCDGTTLWTYNKDNDEVQITKYQPEKGTITPSALFTDFYDKNFLYRLSGSSTVNHKPADVIEMTPLDKSKPYFKVLALIDKSKDQLLSMEIFTKGGYQYTYIINDFIPNPEVSSNDFVFNKKDYPGVNVVDLRM